MAVNVSGLGIHITVRSTMSVWRTPVCPMTLPRIWMSGDSRLSIKTTT